MPLIIWSISYLGRALRAKVSFDQSYPGFQVVGKMTIHYFIIVHVLHSKVVVIRVANYGSVPNRPPQQFVNTPHQGCLIFEAVIELLLLFDNL